LVHCAVAIASAAELPVEAFFRNYQYNEAKLSPDGSCLAVLAPVRKRVGLVVVDLQKRGAHCVYADRTADVHWFQWANTNRLLFGFTKEGYGIGGLMAVNRDGGKLRTLVGVMEVAAFIQSGKNRATAIHPAMSHCSRKRIICSNELVLPCVIVRGKATA